MDDKTRSVLRAIIAALNVERDRLGRLEDFRGGNEAMRQFALEYKVPHGGYDRVDQAVMLLQALCGDKIDSVASNQ